ncbi:EAL domain-containing protein [Pseudonocardiaceae bacterium YIM PH 21723]|nr:EAL domain-containing protein [Pseudonocardiaceae bacterium YIM PH 21723]
MSKPHQQHAQSTGYPPDLVRGRSVLARKWSYLLSQAVVTAVAGADLDKLVAEQLDVLCDAVRTHPFDARPPELVGQRLVAMGFITDGGLRCTLDVLSKGLVNLAEFTPGDLGQIMLALNALSCGYVTATKDAVFEQQEGMQMALLKAVRDARSRIQRSEARMGAFEQSTTSGLLVLSLEGQVRRANATIGQMLHRPSAELIGRDVTGLFPECDNRLTEALEALRDGRADKTKLPMRLLDADTEDLHVTVSLTLAKGPDGLPTEFVMVIEDGTELTLLQHELHRQSLTDVLTGLPNRQAFVGRVQDVLRSADPAHGVTLIHLDLDSFGLVTGSLGRQAGEQLLAHVAGTLRGALREEQALISRFDGDEFGILLENSATTPDIGTLIARLSRELAEPMYLDEHGVACTASFGVVHRPSPRFTPAELLRVAARTLSRAKAAGRGQWELYDPEQDAADLRRQSLAVSMSGAWENGLISVRYRPVVALTDERVAALEARLRWDLDEDDTEPILHDECVRLADKTGLMLTLGTSMMEIAAGQATWWRQRIDMRRPMIVSLTGNQLSDGELVSRVIKVQENTGLKPAQLMFGVPTAEVRTDDAVDNLTVLDDMGFEIMLDDFGLGPGDLAAVTELPVHGVRVARRLVDIGDVTGWDFVAGLVDQVRQTGAAVIVDGVDGELQARRWLEAGAQLASGKLAGMAVDPGDIVSLLAAEV